MTSGFAAEVEAWCRAAEKAAERVLEEAVRIAADEARAHAGEGEDADAVRRSLKQSREDGAVSLGFGAERAQALNYGFTVTGPDGRKHSQPGRNFIGLTVRRWPRIVAQAAANITK